jgi:hypothetical protein
MVATCGPLTLNEMYDYPQRLYYVQLYDANNNVLGTSSNLQRYLGGNFPTTTPISALFSPSYEVPPVPANNAHGLAIGTFNYVTYELKYTLFFNQTGTTGAHIHGPAAPGVNADVVFALSTTSPATATITLTPEQASWLRLGLLYFNIHTSTNPAGASRGQISATTPSSGPMIGTFTPSAIPVVQSDVASVQITIQGVALALPAVISVAGLVAANPVQSGGSVIVTITKPAGVFALRGPIVYTVSGAPPATSAALFTYGFPAVLSPGTAAMVRFPGAGRTITLTGSLLCDTAAVTGEGACTALPTVTLAGVSATVTAASTSTALVVITQAATAPVSNGSIVVTTVQHGVDTLPFSFSYMPQAQVQSISPNTGSPSGYYQVTISVRAIRPFGLVLFLVSFTSGRAPTCCTAPIQLL